MKILIACECSGIVRNAFASMGHDAWSCDLKPSEVPGNHIVADVLSVLGDGWDLMIGHPECRYVCGSGIHWNNRGRGWEKTEAAVKFFRTMLDAPIPRIALENPVGIIGTRIRPADQWLQPYQFGEDASKNTGLWLKNLPPLRHTKYFPPRIVQDGPHKGRKRWSNQTDGGQNKLGPSETRSADRARTYAGIAEAMADQWSNLSCPSTQQQYELFGNVENSPSNRRLILPACRARTG